MKRFLSTTIILLFMLFAHAQPLSDLVKIRELTNLYEKGNSIVPTLKKKGYKHKGWIHAEGLNDFYGADYYYNNTLLIIT